MAANVRRLAAAATLEVVLEEFQAVPKPVWFSDGFVKHMSFVDQCEEIVITNVIGLHDQPHRIENYVREVIPYYGPSEFSSHFRMQRSTFEELLNFIGPSMAAKSKTVDISSKVLSSLWILSNQESFRGVGDRFGMSKGSLHASFVTFCEEMYSLRSNLITWPSHIEMRDIALRFEESFHFPGVIGCIDGCYIPVKAPSSHRNSYITRKGFAAIQLQAICDHKLMYRDVFVGYPGSVHDARVFRNSPIYESLLNLPENYHILGDSAYPLDLSIMTPYRDNGHLSVKQKKYQRVHSSARSSIEHSFALLKCKFRRLKMLDMSRLNDIPKVVVACCMLHNLIIKHEKTDVPTMTDQADGCVVPIGPTQNAAANRKRDAICENL